MFLPPWLSAAFDKHADCWNVPPLQKVAATGDAFQYRAVHIAVKQLPQGRYTLLVARYDGALDTGHCLLTVKSSKPLTPVVPAGEEYPFKVVRTGVCSTWGLSPLP